jgi:hypothetical protein
MQRSWIILPFISSDLPKCFRVRVPIIYGLQACELDDANYSAGARNNGGFIKIIKTLRIFKVILYVTQLKLLCSCIVHYWGDVCYSWVGFWKSSSYSGEKYSAPHSPACTHARVLHMLTIHLDAHAYAALAHIARAHTRSHAPKRAKLQTKCGCKIILPLKSPKTSPHTNGGNIHFSHTLRQLPHSVKTLNETDYLIDLGGWNFCLEKPYNLLYIPNCLLPEAYFAKRFCATCCWMGNIHISAFCQKNWTSRRRVCACSSSLSFWRDLFTSVRASSGV